MTWIDKALSAIGLQRKRPAPTRSDAGAPPESRRPKDHTEYFVYPPNVAGRHEWLARAYIYDTEPVRRRGVLHYDPTIMEEHGVASSKESARSAAQAWTRSQVTT